ncbi:MAG TPA: serine hydrolase domain-containing protein [Gemmatimonadaceae bacterium]|jgi:serine beta-lactamase-like protein LACTB|nr:serine hydrolase domain-containing protein [Gemmatimonadaceae bacterium]
MRQLSVLAFLALSSVASAQPARVDSAIAKFMATSHAPGIAVAAVVHGNPAWAKGYGMADLENAVPVTAHTLFRLGSVSKPITATEAMILWERGKLDLDAPIQRYCPSFPEKPWPITTRELLGHLGGIRHYKSGPDDLEGGNTKHFTDGIAGGIAFFASDTLVAQPGTRFNYSTMGYTLVGCAIAGAAGTSYVDAVRENVFVPAGMTETQADDRFAIIRHRTRFYHRDSTGQVQNADFLDASYKVPGGGWLSSAIDLAKFESALYHDTLMRRSTRTLMWTAQHTTRDSVTGYGLGWGISADSTCARCVGHTGGQQGTTTVILLDPDHEMGVVVLANMDNVDVYRLAAAVHAIAIGNH